MAAGTAEVADHGPPLGGQLRILQPRRGGIFGSGGPALQIGGNVAALLHGQAQVGHDRGVLHLQGASADGTFVVLEIEKERFSGGRVVFGSDVPLEGRTIGERPFPRVVDPAHQVVIVHLVAHAAQIGRKGPSDRLITFANRVTGHAPSGFEQDLAPFRITLSLFLQISIDAGLPDERRDGLGLILLQTKARHFGGGPESVGILDPPRQPVAPQLDSNLLEIRPGCLDLFQKLPAPLPLPLGPSVEVGDPQCETIRLRVEAVRLLVGFGLVGPGHRPLDQESDGLLFAFQGRYVFLVDQQRKPFLVKALPGMAAPTAAPPELLAARAQHRGHVQPGGIPVAPQAAGFHILGRVEGPEPMLVPSVASVRTYGSDSVAIVTGGAAVHLRIVDLQQLLPGMAGKEFHSAHVGGPDRHRRGDPQVTRLAPVHQAHVSIVDLVDPVLEVVQRIDQALNLTGREPFHAVRHVGLHLSPDPARPLQHLRFPGPNPTLLLFQGIEPVLPFDIAQLLRGVFSGKHDLVASLFQLLAVFFVTLSG